MNTRRILTISTAAALAVASTAAYGASPSGAPLDPSARAAAELESPNAISEGGQVLLGLLLAIVFAMAVISGGGSEPDNPVSP